MPAQSPSTGSGQGGSSRNEPSSFLTSVQGKIPVLNRKSRSFFLFLLASSTIILIIVIFLLDIRRDASVPLSEKPFKEDLFINVSKGQRFEELVQDSSFEGLNKAYFSLTNEYIREPSAKKRQALIQLRELIVSMYSEEAKQLPQVPCREDSCGYNADYSGKLSEIRTSIESNKSIGDPQKKSILNNLENAAIAKASGDSSSEFNGLNDAFQNIRDLWKETKDASLKSLSEELTALMERADQEKFQFGTSNKLFDI